MTGGRDLTPDGEATLVVEEPRFALVPEWVIDADINDAAFPLYCLLLRYGNSSGCRMPSRPTLARRLRRSVGAVDRAMHQLVAAGIVRVEHRRADAQFLTNRYHVRTSDPPRPGPFRVVAADLRSPRVLVLKLAAFVRLPLAAVPPGSCVTRCATRGCWPGKRPACSNCAAAGSNSASAPDARTPGRAG